MDRRQQQEQINESIKRLSNSSSYRNTHIEITYLSRNKDWTIEQIRELCKAAVNNSQVYGIFNDDDVIAFYSNLLSNVVDSYYAIDEVKTMINRTDY